MYDREPVVGLPAFSLCSCPDMPDIATKAEGAGERRPVFLEYFDVAGLPEEERFAALVAANRSSHLTRLSGGPFAASARFWRLGQQIWVDQWLDPLVFERDIQLARSIPLTHYSVIVILDGACTLTRGEAEVLCSAGDVIVTDVSRPERSCSTRFHSLHIRIPRASMDAIMPPVALHGRVPRSLALDVFVKHVTAIADSVDGLDEVQAALLANSTCYHLAAALVGVVADEDHDVTALPRERAKHFMAQQPNGSLNIGAMCRALGITRSTLFRAFKPDGGVLAFDRKRRLVGLHEALTNRLDRRPLALLAVEYGFSDKEHLRRTFQDAFGYSPSQLRAHTRMQPHHAAEPGSVQDNFLKAIQSLKA